MTDIIDFILSRRSVTARNMTEPGPSADELDKILRAGMRVPDHGRLGPWRFIVIKGEARVAFGDVLGEAFKIENPDPCSKKLKKEVCKSKRINLTDPQGTFFRRCSDNFLLCRPTSDSY